VVVERCRSVQEGRSTRPVHIHELGRSFGVFIASYAGRPLALNQLTGIPVLYRRGLKGDLAEALSQRTNEQAMPESSSFFVILQPSSPLDGCLDITAGWDDIERPLIRHCKCWQRRSGRRGREISLHPRGHQAGLERFNDMGVERKLLTDLLNPIVCASNPASIGNIESPLVSLLRLGCRYLSG